MTIEYQPFTHSGGAVLPPNQTLRAGQYLSSQNGRFKLRLRDDGHLVLEEGGVVVWMADGNQPYSLTFHRRRMREPLQFVVSNSGFLYDPSRGRIGSAQSTETLDKSYWYNNLIVSREVV